MSNRDLAKNLIDQIPESKLVFIIPYLQGAAIPDEMPNEKTLEAFEAVSYTHLGHHDQDGSLGRAQSAHAADHGVGDQGPQDSAQHHVAGRHLHETAYGLPPCKEPDRHTGDKRGELHPARGHPDAGLIRHLRVKYALYTCLLYTSSFPLPGGFRTCTG